MPAGGKKAQAAPKKEEGKQAAGKDAKKQPAQQPKKEKAKGKGGNSIADDVEAKLGDNMWIGGQQPSKEDAEAFTAMGGSPNPETHPDAYSWWSLCSRFTDDVRATWFTNFQ